MADYGQFCTVARGAEIFGERWTPLVIRELLCGSTRFNDIRRFVQLAAFPAERRIVIHFRFRDARPREDCWWLVVVHGEADLCRDDPGHELTLVVESTLRALTEIWTGGSDPKSELACGALTVSGGKRDRDRLWHWLGRSVFASSRPASD